MKARTTNPKSTINTIKARREKELGPLVNDKKPWTPQDKNLLLICYLGGMKYISDGVSLYFIFGRSEKSLSRMVWGTAVEYCNPKSGYTIGSYYEPYQRYFRRGKPWTKREYRVLFNCLENRGKYSFFSWLRVAEIMGREENEVRCKVYDVTAPKPGSVILPEEVQPISEEELINKAIPILKKLAK